MFQNFILIAATLLFAIHFVHLKLLEGVGVSLGFILY